MAKQAKTLNQQELRRVLDYVATRKHSLRNRALITISMYSGMRCGEISNLLYSDVIDAEGKVRNEIRLRAEDTKTKEARTVFVSEKLQKELQQYAKVYKPKDANVKFIYSQKEDSDGFSPNTLCQLYFNIYKGAGLLNCSSHSGRRTFATEIANKGVSIRVLQKLLGHKNIQTTAIYVDANDDMLRKAVNLA
ncbi:MAG: integrase [Polynucleobacter sp. 35-46-207]|nr:MAG: integrase [Polynucleobacter sp. 35-46-207]OZB48852.1 MAG: integrase [Polynucleobacter sp. 39-45-136]